MNAPAAKANRLEKRLISFGAAILALLFSKNSTQQRFGWNDRRKLFTTNRNNGRDGRGKPRIVPNYRRLD